MAKKPEGRPPKPASERRSVILNMRITRAEQRKLAAEAKQSGLSMSAYLRQKLLGGEK